MYLRYREPSWDASDPAEATSPRSPATGGGRRRHRDTPKSGNNAAAFLREPVRNFPVVELNGVKLHAVTESQVISHILGELNANRGGVVVTPNLDHLRRYLHDLSFGALIAEADLVVADGMPLVWASRLQGTPLPERIPGSTLISTLSAAAGAQGRSIFLLGGDIGTADGAAAALKKQYPSCIIVGTHFPPFGFQEDFQQMSIIIQKLSETQPDIVYVALGSPKQEKLIAKLRSVLPDAWWIGVGNSFSFLAGHVKRAPIWMQKTGLEWVHRLLQEPRRLFRRYLIVGVPFAVSLLARSSIRGIPHRIRRLMGKPIAPVAFNGLPTLPPRKSPDELLQAEAMLRSSTVETGPSLSIGTSTSLSVSSPAQPAAASRLRALVLLGGSVRTSELSNATQRAVVDLPLDRTGSILNHWLAHAGEVARWASIEKLPVRVKVNQNAAGPQSADHRYYGHFRVERDLSEYRGTGGVLHDLAADYDDEDFILMANAAQVLLEPLQAITAALFRKGGDVTVVSHEDGTPSGIMLIKCKTLRLIPSRGFVDMKEQGLPLIASKYDVRVMRRRKPTGLPVRSLTDYVQALRLHHRELSGRQSTIDPLAEDWGPTFSIIEEGGSVDHSARVHDSIVLRGARVEPGAIVVRSVVCPGAVVGRDRTAVDQIVFDLKGGRPAVAPTTGTTAVS